MKGAFNVQTGSLDFKAILVSDFANRAWSACQNQALGRNGFVDPKKGQIATYHLPVKQETRRANAWRDFC